MNGSATRAQKVRMTFLLGHRGMLGALVQRYLRERGHVILITERRARAAVWAWVFTSPPPPKKSPKTSCFGCSERYSNTGSISDP